MPVYNIHSAKELNICTTRIQFNYTRFFSTKQLRILSRTRRPCLIPRPKLVPELFNWLLKFFLCNPEVPLKKGKK